MPLDPDCAAGNHLKDSDDDYCCTVCEAEQCPDCLAWFPDEPTFWVHLEAPHPAAS